MADILQGLDFQCDPTAPLIDRSNGGFISLSDYLRLIYYNAFYFQCVAIVQLMMLCE